MEEVLGNMRADTAKGWLLGSNAVYQTYPTRRATGAQPGSVHGARARTREGERGPARSAIEGIGVDDAAGARQATPARRQGSASANSAKISAATLRSASKLRGSKVSPWCRAPSPIQKKNGKAQVPSRNASMLTVAPGSMSKVTPSISVLVWAVSWIADRRAFG